MYAQSSGLARKLMGEIDLVAMARRVDDKGAELASANRLRAAGHFGEADRLIAFVAAASGKIERQGD